MIYLQLTPLEAARWAHHKLYCDRLRGPPKSCLGVPYSETSILDLEEMLLKNLYSGNQKRLLSEVVL